MTTFVRVCLDDLIYKQKQDTLRVIALIKDKQCGKIKVIACADGRAQRAYITK